jgi:hypothetical protein
MKAYYPARIKKLFLAAPSEKVARGMKLKANMAVRSTLISYFSGNRTP